MVNPLAQAHRGLGTTLFSLLNPIPFGFFVGALIFDAIYLNSAEVMWGKAWLITFGLLIAIVPRLINLFAVWRRNGNATHRPHRLLAQPGRGGAGHLERLRAAAMRMPLQCRARFCRR